MKKYAELFLKVEQFYKKAFVKVSYIRQVGGKWRVFSEKGKNMGTFPTKALAEKRLRQIEYFKHQK